MIKSLKQKNKGLARSIARKATAEGSTTEGFTLVEMMTAISLFLVIMTISMGSILNVFDVNRKSESMKTVMDNLNFAIETMSREMRFGRIYHCGATEPFTTPVDCIATPGTQISFLSSDNQQITYRLINNQVEKKIDNGDFIAVTAPEITIENLSFYVVGTASNDGLQPKALITIRGKSGAKINTTTEFSVQTLVSQRQLDI
ncbi:MAG: prepilin-type N-terminal cleavage/methylation domain-containing protein [Minisyncoccia bacterium]